MSSSTVVQNFYEGANIFITGGTGFMGKVLIDKLLRTCPGIENIYLLIRKKKGKDIHTRIEELFDDPLFEKLRESVPKFRHKIVTVAGDCSIAGLGLSLTDRQTLVSTISIIFHAAATIKFDESLKLAVDINVHGTKDVIQLGKEMKNLKSFIHVSTAYSNCHLNSVKEKFYDYPIGYDHLENIISKLDDRAIEEITPKILCKWPNTYTLTKALAEDLVRNYSGDLPIGVFRPAIVTSTFQEPVVAWIDNLYGPTGVVAGAGSGVLRTMHCNKNINANIVPVDMTVNALIVSAYDVATKKGLQNVETNEKPYEIPIYNYVSSVQNPLTWGKFTDLNVKHGFKYPFSSAIWYMCFFMHKSFYMNKLYTIFLHIIPALLIDFIILCCAKKPKLLKTYKKIHKFANVISFFCTNEWTFTNDNVQSLWLNLSNEDKKLFYFDMQSLDWEEYIKEYMKGMRVYLFKDELSNAEQARKKWRRLYWMHQFVKLTLLSALIYLLYLLYRTII
ncbi:CLUMA_CG013629, isoform A [Clunio marinus]|uniref:Fatty acyl-CoA reductase n=1 Tax=Clunio marinus TaxID=568069 RepID=A0A1J1IJD8_9DIPT|nr:CLUMA_CG013629, isoform A [Clunio marinus]